MQILYNQRGSAAVIGIMAMLFMTIVIGGLLPMVSAEMGSTRMNQGVVEAQYVAEAGAKRALVGFSQSRTDWAWANGTTRNNFQDGTSKAYIVTINPPVVDGVAPASGHYTITSTGFVGDVRKTVSIGIQMTAGGGSNANASGEIFGKYAVFANEKFDIYGGSNPVPAVEGGIGLKGSSVRVDMGQNILASIIDTVNKPSYMYYPNPKAPNPWYILRKLDEIGTLTITMPTFKNIPADANKFPTLPVTNSGGSEYWNGAFTFTQPSYYFGKSYTLSGTTKLTMTNNTPVNLYINGDLHLTTNASIIGDSTLNIYVKGNVLVDNSSSIVVSNSSNNAQLNIYAGGTVKFTSSDTSSSFVQSDNIMIYAGSTADQAVLFDNKFIINKSLPKGITKIYTDGGLKFTNDFAMGGAAAMVLTKKQIVVDNNVNASNTVFISNSGDSTLSGPRVKTAGFYTNGGLYIKESSAVQYNSSVMAALGLAGGGGGKAKVDLDKWSKVN